MSANSFTQEQIFRGLRIIWREALGYEGAVDLNTKRLFGETFATLTPR